MGGSGGLRYPPVMSTLPGEMGWMEPEPRRGGEAERSGAGGGKDGDEGGLSVGGATWVGTSNTRHSFYSPLCSNQKAAPLTPWR